MSEPSEATLERVAKAICCPDGICRNAKPDPRYLSQLPCESIMCRDKARAAITATLSGDD